MVNKSEAKKRDKILVPGRNCWRLEDTERLACLVDADAYFAAFRAAVLNARRSVYIVGWDIDSRTDLLREEPDDDLPRQLGPFLNAVARKNPELHISILLWDFSMLVGFDREWFPIFKLDWQAPANIKLQLDDQHPIGASHHQKIVVIDDRLAFVGGLDLTKSRWDTPAHAPDEEGRQTPEGDHYRPHHDVQLMVEGDSARSLGELVRNRWHAADGDDLAPPPGDLPSPWPQSFRPDAEKCRVAIARTIPAYQDQEEIQEVEQLYIDVISQAEKYIYIENQYLTSPKISAALAKRLSDNQGPEVVIVLPFITDGWLSQFTMDALKCRAIKELRAADHHNRLGIYYPYMQGLSSSESIKIHSKMMLVDDRYMQAGSSNLNNRSMGLDTECDLAFEADREDLRGSIRAIRYRLMAEHLDENVEELRHRQDQTEGSLLKLIEQYSENSRSLRTLTIEQSDLAESWLSEADIFDPEHPIDPEKFLERMVSQDEAKKGQFNLTGLVVIISVILGLAALWRFTPLSDLLDHRNVIAIATGLTEDPLAPLYVMLIYLAGGILVAPITALIALTTAVFGPFTGLGYAFVGTGLSASLTYLMGIISGRNFVRKIAGKKVNMVSKRLARRGIISTAIIRLVPIAPFTVVNMIAGASHISFRDYILGTLIGMTPGMLAIAGLVDRGAAIFKNPGQETYLSLGGMAILIGIGFYFLRRWIREEKQSEAV